MTGQIAALATKTDLDPLRSDMRRGFASMVRWIVGTATASLAIVLSVITLYLNTTQKSAAQPQVQPIVITLPAPAQGK